jgi:hypothetical protein
MTLKINKGKLQMSLVKKYKNLSEDRKQLIVACIVVATGAVVIWNGFDETNATITGCHVRTVAYQTAYFEEDYNSTCLNFDGELESCVKTNYWDKAASPVWNVTSINGSEPTHNVQADENVYLTNVGYYTTPVPEIDYSLEQNWSQNDEYNHDRYSSTYNATHTVYMDRQGESDHLSKDPSFYGQCNEFREQGNSLKVKTWYSISYNVEKFTE